MRGHACVCVKYTHSEKTYFITGRFSAPNSEFYEHVEHLYRRSTSLPPLRLFPPKVLYFIVSLFFFNRLFCHFLFTI